jgi:hypothetical protein
MRILSIDAKTHLEFAGVPLRFEGGTYSDVFAQKNNKTLGETLQHQRYAGLTKRILPKYASSLARPLGIFLSELKRSGDSCYQRFLNPYGDLTYSTFSLANGIHVNAKCIYAYYVGSELKYIGRCRDFLKSRVNTGYEKIHPKNCYIDGQATNCRLNALITQSRGEVGLWLCPIGSDDEIAMTEVLLFRRYIPEWNIQKL